MLYSCPELQGATDHIQAVDPNDIAPCRANCMSRRLCPCEDEDIYELCLMLMVERNFMHPIDAWQALDLYVQLRDVIKTLI